MEDVATKIKQLQLQLDDAYRERDFRKRDIKVSQLQRQLAELVRQQ